MNDYIKHNKQVYLCNYHLIFCPKYRRQLLIGKLKLRLEEIIKEEMVNQYASIIALEVMPDHVHVLYSINPQTPPYKVAKAIKGRSSNLLRKEFPALLKMPTLWTRSYFISTVGNVSTQTAQQYIENQWKK